MRLNNYYNNDNNLELVNSFVINYLCNCKKNQDLKYNDIKLIKLIFSSILCGQPYLKITALHCCLFICHVYQRYLMLSINKIWRQSKPHQNTFSETKVTPFRILLKIYFSPNLYFVA